MRLLGLGAVSLSLSLNTPEYVYYDIDLYTYMYIHIHVYNRAYISTLGRSAVGVLLYIYRCMYVCKYE